MAQSCVIIWICTARGANDRPRNSYPWQDGRFSSRRVTVQSPHILYQPVCPAQEAYLEQVRSVPYLLFGSRGHAINNTDLISYPSANGISVSSGLISTFSCLFWEQNTSAGHERSKCASMVMSLACPRYQKSKHSWSRLLLMHRLKKPCTFTLEITALTTSCVVIRSTTCSQNVVCRPR